MLNVVDDPVHVDPVAEVYTSAYTVNVSVDMDKIVFFKPADVIYGWHWPKFHDCMVNGLVGLTTDYDEKTKGTERLKSRKGISLPMAHGLFRIKRVFDASPVQP